QTLDERSTEHEPRRTVARSLLDPRKRQGQATHRRQGLRDSSGHLGWRASPGSEGSEFQDRVPVTTRTACAKLLVDECVRQARAPDAVRINDVKVLARSPDDFAARDRKSTRLNSSHRTISYAVFCLKKKKQKTKHDKRQ